MANGSGIVLSLEPNPEVATMLRRSVQLNGFANVRLRVLCAGDQTGEATLWENYSRPNQFGMLALDESATGVSVLSVRLDDLVRWEKLESVDYIKIDVEGTEDDVLRGASETIDRFRPVIQVEDGIRPVNTLPSNYVQLRLAASPNRLLLPAESPALQLLRALPDVISVP
jgi:FkbM family methyltransferase